MSEEEFQFKCTASLEMLRRRSQLLREIREFFEGRNFIEVETPLISRDTVVDRYIEPARVPRSEVIQGASRHESFFLQTSPEFAMKRLLASGATAIYQICKAFRKGEEGSRHNPEFTMLEWYRVGDDLEAGMQLLADLASCLTGETNVEKISYRDAFAKHASLNPFEASIDDMKRVCKDANVDAESFAGEKERDAWLNLIMSEIVEPKLGFEKCEIVYHWPASQSALAKVVSTNDGHKCAERFELFYRGVELANGYHELTEAEELLDRNRHVNHQRAGDGAITLPENSYLLEAMREGLPPSSGVALGVDRLLMVITGRESIEEVMAFPIGRA